MEDDKLVRDVPVEMIEELGYEVLTAANGPEALARLKTGEPVDMLFSDILMPGGMSSVALATEARKLDRGSSVLLTSGYTADERVDRRASGFALIEKPYRHDKLAQMLRIALDIRRDVSR